MLRVYVRCALLLVPLWALLAALMSVLGSGQPLHPALRGFIEGCETIPPPCWYGIVPGVTSRTSALDTLLAAGYHVQNHVGSISDGSDGVLVAEAAHLAAAGVTYDDFTVSAISLSLTTWQVHLGDVGLPAGVIFRRDSLVFQIRAQFVAYHTAAGRFSPYTPVTLLSLQSRERPMRSAYNWRGFALPWRYCQSPHRC
ncbi:MAG: hypothetical protein HXY40_01950 [Chloroflexi bacterium]|nr:hypothetical protein [Chloroflexota bacterium]